MKQITFSDQFFVEALMENIHDNIYFKDQQGKFVKINKSQSLFLDLTAAEEAIGKTDFDFFLKRSMPSRLSSMNKR